MSDITADRMDGTPGVTMTGPLLFAGIFVLALANFMAVLDMTIVNVAVPHIAGSLAVSPSQGTWVITSYAVAEAITVPLTGWLSARFGAMRVFITSVVFFGLFSLLCGFAPSLQTLVVFRVLQGLAGGPLMPMSQTLIMRITPPKQMQMGLGLWTMTTILAPIAGPLVGGVIADSAGWPWAFFINVPIAIACAFFAFMLLRGRDSEREKKPVDYIGLGLLIVWVGALQMMLDNGQEKDWFASTEIVLLCVTAVVGFLAFLIWELTEEHPIVDLRVFRHRGFAAASLAMSLTFGSLFASIVLIPLWLQTNMGYTAAWAGYVTAYNGVLGLFMAPIAAYLSTKIDPRKLITFGLLLMSATVTVRVLFTQDMEVGQLILPQLVQGVAMPFFMVPIIGMSMAFVLPSEHASAAGLIDFLRSMSGAFGTAIVTTAWQDATISRHAELVGQIHDPAGVMAQFKAMGMSAAQALDALNNMVQSQAVMLATNHTFLLTGLTVLLAVGAIWLAPRPVEPIAVGLTH